MIDLDSALHANRSIVPLIYESAAGTRAWEDVVQALVEFLDSQLGFITLSYLASGRGEVVASHGLPPEFNALWEERYAINEWVHLAAGQPPGQVLHAARDAPVAALLDTPMGRDLLAPQQLTDGIGVKLTDSPLFVGAISTYSREGILPERALDRLDFLTPHLARALALHQRFAALTTQSRAFERSIDDLGTGIVYFEASGRVLHANAMARSLAEQHDGFAIDGGRLSFSERAMGQRLAEAVAQATSPQPGHVTRGFFRVARPSGRRPYHAVVVPAANAPGGLAGAAEDALALWLSDPDQTFAPNPEAISDLLGLTPAEARITAALVAGRSLLEYAREVGITENTARSTLKHVFAKTDTRSQADLVRLVSQSIPSPPF